MNKLPLTTLILSTLLLVASCVDPNPNLNNQGEDELKSLEVDHQIDKGSMSYKDIIYVPIYSDIYIDTKTQKSLLAATLSIRNTSFTDSLFVSKINYFNTDGTLVRSYLDKAISLPPMATINYVVEKEDDTGGTGANFVIELSANSEDIKPIVQAIMVEYSGNKGFAFSTDGYSIK